MVSAKPATKKRGSRLSEDWQPGSDAIAWAMSDRGMTRTEVDEQTDRFRDHFIGTGEAKADWLATWKNWIRRAPEFSGKRTGNGGQPAKDDHRSVESAHDYFARRGGGGKLR